MADESCDKLSEEPKTDEMTEEKNEQQSWESSPDSADNDLDKLRCTEKHVDNDELLTSSDIGSEKLLIDKEEEKSQTVSRETVNFRVVWNKKNYDVSFGLDETFDSLKQHIESLTGLPVTMQKLMYKGLVKDGTKSLRSLNVTSGVKMMVIGSTLNDVMKVTPPPPGTLKDEKSATGTTKEPFCKQKMHKKVLDKGKPDDVIPGIKHIKEKLPQAPLSGMYNKHGGKVRLTFKLELDQLWIGTKERTEKIPMGSIKTIVSEAIEEHEEYHIMGIQLGPTEASRYWVYWVPAQYVDAIKDTVLGKWQPF